MSPIVLFENSSVCRDDNIPFDTDAGAHRPGSLSKYRLNRRGITTVQPGLEDATSDAYNHTAIHNSHGDSPYDSDQIISNNSSTKGGVQIAIPTPDKHGQPASPPQEKKKKSLFSRVAGTSKNKTTDALPEKRSLTPPRAPLTKGYSTTSDEGRLALASASPPLKGGTISGGPPSSSQASIAMTESTKASPAKPSKKRDKKTNHEATQLRNQMLAAEYELARLMKSIRKKTVVAPAAKTDKHHITQEEYNSLISQQNEQQTKLQELKNKYTALTGKSTAFVAAWLIIVCRRGFHGSQVHLWSSPYLR